MENEDFETIKRIFEKLLINQKDSDPNEINGDDIEDFCKTLSMKLNKFYANV